jgi:hypothetical protein
VLVGLGGSFYPSGWEFSGSGSGLGLAFPLHLGATSLRSQLCCRNGWNTVLITSGIFNGIPPPGED